LNFATCDFYYYDGVNVTNNNLYNKYWRRTVNQINTGKMLIAYFDLNESDIQAMRLNDKIRIDNSWWNINKIIDYNANVKGFTKVELISIDSEIDFAPFSYKIPKLPVASQVSHVTKSILQTSVDNNNVVMTGADVVIKGRNNVVLSGTNGMIIGDDNIVTERYVNITPPSGDIRTVSESFTIEPSDKIFIMNSPSKTTTLPLAADSLGRILIGKNISSGNLTILASGTDKIEGLSSITIATGRAGMIVSDGVGWWIISQY